MKKQIKLKLIFALVIGAIALAFAPFCLNVKMASDNQNQNNDDEEIVDVDGDRSINDNSNALMVQNGSASKHFVCIYISEDLKNNTLTQDKVIVNFNGGTSASNKNLCIVNGSILYLYTGSFTSVPLSNFNVGDYLVIKKSGESYIRYYKYSYSNNAWSGTLLYSYSYNYSNIVCSYTPLIPIMDQIGRDTLDESLLVVPQVINNTTYIYDELAIVDNTYNCYYFKEQDSFYDVNNTNHVVVNWLDDEDVLHELRVDDSKLYLDVTSDNSVSTTIIGEYNKDDVIAMVIYRNTNLRSVPVYIYININTLSCSLNNGVVSFESNHKFQFGDNITVNNLKYTNDLVTFSYFTDNDYNLVDPLFRGDEIVEEVFDSYMNNALQHSYDLGVQNGSVSNYSDLVFDNCRLYGWALSSLGDADNVLYYYNDSYNEVDPEYDIIENAVSDGNWVSLQNLNDFYSVDFPSNYFYMLLVPNVTITDSFTIRFTNSVGGNVHILYDNFEYVDDAFSGTDYTYVIPQEFLGHSIIALGFVNYTDNNYCRYITCTSSEIVASMYYQQGYDSGYRRGYDFGQDDANDVFNSEKAILVSTIRSQQEQLDTLNANNVNLTFRDTLNTILSYPVKLVRRVFYNEKLVVDANNQPVLDAYGNAQYESTTPIELFGVSLPGLVMGIFAIALTIGVIAIVKKVWK